MSFSGPELALLYAPRSTVVFLLRVTLTQAAALREGLGPARHATAPGIWGTRPFVLAWDPVFFEGSCLPEVCSQGVA